MPLIKWNDSFNVNIEIIDKQHQLLVKMINDLYDAMVKKQDRETLGKLLKQLGVYAAMHFAREEHYFEMLNYPDIKAHLKEHDYFEDKIAAFEEDFETGRQNLSLDIMKFLATWLLEHIKKRDQKYSAFLRSHGIE